MILDLVLAAKTRKQTASERSRSAKDGERRVVSGHGEARPGLLNLGIEVSQEELL